MKTKVIGKLKLNKHTVVNLEAKDLDTMKGGTGQNRTPNCITGAELCTNVPQECTHHCTHGITCDKVM